MRLLWPSLTVSSPNLGNKELAADVVTSNYVGLVVILYDKTEEEGSGRVCACVCVGVCVCV